MIAVILAGGSGTRFWPLSRKDRPKQLVRLFGDRVMIGQTVERLSRITTTDRIVVVCGEHLIGAMREALPELDEDNFLIEPAARNTAPAIALAAMWANHRFPGEVVGVFPSDHFIGAPDRFASAVELASDAAKLGHIVTLGMQPNRPETGYGYIKQGGAVDGAQGVHVVDAFVEKPDHERALEYLSAGGYLWNAGMFFFTPETLMGEVERQLPEMYEGILGIAADFDMPTYDETLSSVFPTLESISIDYGVMENAGSVCVVPAEFAWSDVGHWAALPEIRETDEHSNVLEAPVILHDVEDCVFYSTNDARPIAAAGVKGLVVVDTPEAVLVIPKERCQDVRELKRMFDDSK